MSGITQHENRLKDELSPYLKQHAGNPVDWYPWGDEALGRARKEDKPLIISIGYSSCHWCHVMERESFEDAEVARIMNGNFISIKVDREERPDLDSLYIKAVHAMTGQAGWPLTVFATPEGVPFYGGSYFPPAESFGMPSFKKVLLAVSEAYRHNRDRVTEVTADIEEALRGEKAELSMPGPEVSRAAFEAALLYFDPVYGGFGGGMKFPHAMFLKFLLRFHERTNEPDALKMVRKTLAMMYNGGIYDHLGGGFHRYSVDERWEVPHFEKMLYDNALLSELYAIAYEKTGSEPFKEAALATLGYMARDLGAKEGGFYSAQDADVGVHEGEYYLWDAREVRYALKEGAERFMDFYSITEEGNYEGMNTLRIKEAPEGYALPDEGIRKMKEELYRIRMKRRPPDTDKKIITAWNGLAITALVQAYRAFGNKEFLDQALRCSGFLLSNLKDGDGRLFRYYLNGRAEVKGLLEDYAIFSGALLSVHEATGAGVWLKEAKGLAEAMLRLFYDEGSGLFYDIGSDQERLFVRERDLSDNDLPSGASAAAATLLKLSRATGEKGWLELSENILATAGGIAEEPLSHGNFLTVLESLLSGKERG